MSAENKYKELLSKVHQGVPAEKSKEKDRPNNEEGKSVAEVKVVANVVEPASIPAEAVLKYEESPMNSIATTKPAEKRKRKTCGDYQGVFFNRIDFTHRKPLYITATTQRRLMRIVHLMDESKATISSYVENIILNHLETFKEDIDTIYQNNNMNPTE